MLILSSGDDPKTSTGYGQIWDNLLSRWAKLKPDWKFYHIGWQNRDREHQTKEGYYMLPIERVEYGFDVVASYLLKYKPDIFVTLADVGIMAGFIDGVAKAKRNGWVGRWIAYSLVDTESWDYVTWGKILDCPDLVIPCAKNAELLYKKFNVKNVGSTISCGVDNDIYKPLDNKDKLKTAFNLQNKFVVGFIGKNQRRKMHPLLIKGFSQFSKDKEDVTLLLHTDVESPAGWSMPCLIAKNEKEIDPKLIKPHPKVIFTNPKLDVISRQRLQPEHMNEIFNLMDVFCYSTGGEGFGMPGIECQSAGVPLMMTDYSSAVEILCDKDLAIPILEDKYKRKIGEVGANSIENAIPDDVAIAELLNKLYREWKEGKLQERSKRAREFALNYGWDKIAEKWVKLFENEK